MRIISLLLVCLLTGCASVSRSVYIEVHGHEVHVEEKGTGFWLVGEWDTTASVTFDEDAGVLAEAADTKTKDAVDSIFLSGIGFLAGWVAK